MIMNSDHLKIFLFPTKNLIIKQNVKYLIFPGFFSAGEGWSGVDQDPGPPFGDAQVPDAFDPDQRATQVLLRGHSGGRDQRQPVVN